MKQQVFVDFTKGELSAQWVERERDFSEPYIVYDFSNNNLSKNTTSATNNDQTTFLLNWYNNWSDLSSTIESNNLSWILNLN
jgi:hypothetical protein